MKQNNNNSINALWSLGNDDDSFAVEFNTEISDTSKLNTSIKANVYVEDKQISSHEMNNNNNEFKINIEPTIKHYGVIGNFIADFLEKRVTFNGSIIPRTSAYCTIQDYSESHIDRELIDINWNVFSWI
jgi:hypothetical protein